MKANAPQLWRIKIESNDIVLDDGRIMRIAETIIPERKISRKEIPEVISNYLNEVTLPMLKEYHLDVSDFDVVIGCWCPKWNECIGLVYDRHANDSLYRAYR